MSGTLVLDSEALSQTRVPSRIRSVAVAAAVRVGTAPNHGPSRNVRQERWS
ncbi:hypothetical protein M2266_000789 [Streptomyces sp. SPB162]|nr:hypothetical protein [Streptomyces sp. SPB162]